MRKHTLSEVIAHHIVQTTESAMDRPPKRGRVRVWLYNILGAMFMISVAILFFYLLTN